MNKSQLPIVLLLLVILGLLFVIVTKPNGSGTSETASAQAANGEKAKASQQLNKMYTFPLRDENNDEISKFTYKIQNAELHDQIIVKGQPWVSVKGKTILVLNLEITNNYSKGIQINARDYVRLTINNDGKNLAPEIHNDPVEVQAISTKYTRLGFPISDTDKNLTLHVGEITGKKDTIHLQLH